MSKKRVWIVWLVRPGEPKRFSAAFDSKEAADKYAILDDLTTEYKTSVTEEPVHSTDNMP